MIAKRYFQDLFSLSYLQWQKFDHKIFFITGATGLIGRSLISCLYHVANEKHICVSIAALVRNREKANAMFRPLLDDHFDLRLLEGSTEALPDIPFHIDYIVHAAAPTGSLYFTEFPVQTIQAVAFGTDRVLALAKEKKPAAMVFLSSMEVYGLIPDERTLSENNLGDVDLTSPRSSYPLSKRLAEHLCYCYAKEYGVPVSIARLAQTFGPGVPSDDQRVFAYLARCVLHQEDIVLQTSGNKKNMYLYTLDAVSAILLLLQAGTPGEIYNVANPETYCSVKEMAELVASLSDHNIHVVTGQSVGGERNQFRPDGFLRLDTSKLGLLGWRPTCSLEEMYRNMITAFLHSN